MPQSQVTVTSKSDQFLAANQHNSSSCISLRLPSSNRTITDLKCPSTKEEEKRRKRFLSSQEHKRKKKKKKKRRKLSNYSASSTSARPLQFKSKQDTKAMSLLVENQILYSLPRLFMLLLLCCCYIVITTTTISQTFAHSSSAHDKQTLAGLTEQLNYGDGANHHGQLLKRLNELGADYQVIYMRRDYHGQASLVLEPEEELSRESSSFFGATSPQLRARSSTLLAAINGSAANYQQALGHYNRTNVVIRALDYHLRLELELNNNLFGPELIQKHFLPKGAHFSTQKLERCYYHARSVASPSHNNNTNNKDFGDGLHQRRSGREPRAIGALRTCNGLSGIIHVNNESLVIHPFYSPIVSGSVDLASTLGSMTAGQSGSSSNTETEPHIIYRYKFTGTNGQQSSDDNSIGDCGNSDLHEWALKQYNKGDSSNQIQKSGQFKKRSQLDEESDENCSTASGDCDKSSGRQQQQQQQSTKSSQNGSNKSYLLSKRDVGLKEKYIELALVLSQDMFTKRNLSTRLEVLQDAIQIINCLDLYFRSANTRVAIVYIETWAHGDQISISADIKQTLYNFLDYSTRKLYKVSMDSIHLLTGGQAQRFLDNKSGMSIPDSICTPRAVSVSQETNVFEPFVAASTIAHMLGHNLGMEHDNDQEEQRQQAHTSSTSQASNKDDNYSRSLGEPVGQQPSGFSATLRPQLGFKPYSSATHRPHQASSESELQDDHEEETKSARSLSSSALSMAEDETQDNKSYGPTYCRANCLMNEKLLYLQAPVALGNMIQINGSIEAIQVDNNQEDYDSMSSTNNQATMRSSSKINEPDDNAALPFRFSKKSIDTYHKLLRLGHGICLFNKPHQVEDFSTCGNGIKEEGEDCDCGKLGECFEHDSCCDPITCKFRAGVQCISGACCDRCQFRPRGFVCRKARDECDLAETCDGKSYACSPDVFKQNGHSCGGGKGYCYLGQCPTHDAQCLDLWGSDGRQADKYCYSSLNSNGTILGNCGLREPQFAGSASGHHQLLVAPNRNGNSIVGTARSFQTGSNLMAMTPVSGLGKSTSQSLTKFRRCEAESVLCGTLQCELGDMRPVIADDEDNNNDNNNNSNSARPDNDNHNVGAENGPSPSIKHEYSRIVLKNPATGREHECKTVTKTTRLTGKTNRQAASISSISYVRQGSKCGNNKVCFEQACQPIDVVYAEAYKLCPRDELGAFCSGHGICSTANRCHCDAGWKSADCSQRDEEEYLERQQQRETSELAPVPVKKNFVDSGHQSVIYTTASSNERLGSTILGTTEQVSSTTDRAAFSLTTSSSGTTMTAATTTASSAPETPAPSTSSNFQVPDKKKHDALSAPTLVLILVSIVAAVYVGFALMANCYRRKRFIKPDKVLRYHQMNCKLDALRSSFIAKRLADAEMAAVSVDMLPEPSHQQQRAWSTTAGHFNKSNEALMRPMPGLSQQQHPSYRHENFGGQSGAHYLAGQHQVHAVHYNFEQQQQQHQQLEQHILGNELSGSGDHIPLLLSASEVHRKRIMQRNQQQPRSTFTAGPQLAQRQQSLSSSSNNNNSGGPLIMFTGKAQHQFRTLQQLQQQRKSSFTSNQMMGRALSLGNVNQPTITTTPPPQDSFEDLNDAEDQDLDQFNNNNNAAIYFRGPQSRTPARAARAPPPSSLIGRRRQHQNNGLPRERLTNPTFVHASVTDAPLELDSCSAPSSPERRPRGTALYWRQANSSRVARVYQEHNLLLDRALELAASRQGALSASGQQMAAAGDESPLSPPLPPPPPPLALADEDRMLASDSISARCGGADDGVEQQRVRGDYGDARGNQSGSEHESEPPDAGDEAAAAAAQEQEQDDDEDADADEDDEDALGCISIRSCASSSLRPRSGLDQQQPPRRLARQGAPSDSQQRRKQRESSAAASAAVTAANQWSLIAQLQQLEQFQSLHQRQTSSLHEFFSLPLSVQLSALLARSLAEQQQQPGFFSSTSLGASSQHQQNQQLDELLNSLNNSSVAKSSRRSFRAPIVANRAGQQQTAILAPSRSNEIDATASPSTSTPRGAASLRKQQQQQQQNHVLQAQNLQALIGRLQKLHNQTLLQQQQQQQKQPLKHLHRQQLDYEHNEDEQRAILNASRRSLTGSRQSTLSRARERQQQQLGGEFNGHDDGADEEYNEEYEEGPQLSSGMASTRRRQSQQQLAKSANRRSQLRRGDSSGACPRPRSNAVLHSQATSNNRQQQQQQQPSRPTSRSEFVYSMSDSEDGSCDYVSRMLAATNTNATSVFQPSRSTQQTEQQQHQQQSVNNNNNHVSMTKVEPISTSIPANTTANDDQQQQQSSRFESKSSSPTAEPQSRQGQNKSSKTSSATKSSSSTDSTTSSSGAR